MRATHNFVKARKWYRLNQATASNDSAHSPQTKLELVLDFHCMFSSDSILILEKWSGSYDN